MLKHIPKEFTPELIGLLMEMGHGEELLICDANFPWKSQGLYPVYLPVDSIADLLKDILYFFPLDESEPDPVWMMKSAAQSGALKKCDVVLAQNDFRAGIQCEERFAFYEHARRAAGVVVTADTTRGGNILIRKGVVTP